MRNIRNLKPSVTFALATFILVTGAYAQMKQPKMATLKGTVVDMTCSAKAKGMSGMWGNVEEDHMMPDGKIQKNCATMCLQGGQAAALYDGSDVTAVFACNPQPTLSKFASKEVEVQGFWGGDKAFVPMKIRVGSDAWTDVDCANMHN